MEKKPCELVDLPPEMVQLLVEKCDLITRCRLRASSMSMNEIVASTKLFIPYFKIKELSNEGVLLKITIKLFKDEYTLKFKKNATGGTRLCQAFRNEIVIDESKPADEALSFFKQICLQKNVTLGVLNFEEYEKSGELKKRFEEVIDNANFPMKIKSIHWNGSNASGVIWKLIEHCDKTVLKELKVGGKLTEGGLELFGKHDEILKNLERIEVEGDCNATDENVFSLNAAVISLKSEHFTVDMASRLIEKFANKRDIESSLRIETTSMKKLDSNITLAGFERIDGISAHTDYFNKLPDDKEHVVHLRITEKSIRLQVSDTNEQYPWDEQVFIEPPDYDDDSSEYDFYDDFDDLEYDYYRNGYDTDPEYNLYAQRGFHESDFDDEEDETDYGY